MKRVLLVLLAFASPAYAKHKTKKPKVVKLATKQVDADNLASDGTTLYWTAGDHTVQSIALAGGKVTTAVPGNVASFAVAGGNLYYADFDGAIHAGATTLATGQKGAQFLVSDGKSVYWSIYGEQGAIAGVPIAGGKVVSIATAQADPGALTVDATRAYWSLNDGTVLAAPLAGGKPTTIATGPTHPGGITADASNLYWVAGDEDGVIDSVPLAGGKQAQLASKQATPMFITVDATNVYWVNMGRDTSTERSNDGNDGTVMEMPLAGGKPKTLASKLGAPSGLVQDATHLYVSDQRTGIIWSIPK